MGPPDIVTIYADADIERFREQFRVAIERSYYDLARFVWVEKDAAFCALSALGKDRQPIDVPVCSLCREDVRP